MGENDEVPLITKVMTTVLVLIAMGFVCLAFMILNQNQPLLIGDDMSVWFEHEYSDLREREVPIYQNIQLDGSAMVITFRNLSLTRNYLLVQRKDDKSWGIWIEFNKTETETLWFNHNNKEFYLCAWIYRDKWHADGWDKIISFSVVED